MCHGTGSRLLIPPTKPRHKSRDESDGGAGAGVPRQIDKPSRRAILRVGIVR